MAKIAITQLTTDLDNIQALADVVQGQAATVKQTFDEAGNEIKTYVNSSLITELNGNTGEHMIGVNNVNLGSDNVGDALEEIRLVAVQAQAGTIADNSITNAKLAVDVKVGSLASLTTTEQSSVVGAINELDSDIGTLTTTTGTNTTNIASLENSRTVKTSTGSAVAYALDTLGTFDLTKDGNQVTFIPNVSNTVACTINLDAQGAKNILKPDGVGGTTALVAGDITIGTPVTLIRVVGGDFFLLAPRGGSNIKSVQRGIATFAGWTTQTTVNYTAVDTDNTAILLNSLVVDGACSQARLGVTNFTATSFTAQKGVAGNSSTVAWQAIEFKDLKSFQRGNKSIFGTSGTQVITGVDLSKSFILFNFYTEYGLANAIGMDMRVYLTSSTQISFEVGGAGNWFVDWYVIETK